jgi:hypothetical protein
LTLPDELWESLTAAHQEVYRRADSLLRMFGGDRRLPLRDVFSRAQATAEEVLAALQVLDGMSLVSIDSTDTGPIVTLLAMPDEHVRLTGPDGQTRWLFVARPLDPPVIDAANLN